MSGATVSALREHRTPKGDPLEAARLAGIMAAKKTSDLIPLCHPLPLTHIDVQATLEEARRFRFRRRFRQTLRLAWRWKR